MKFSYAATAAIIAVASATPIEYGPPKGGWASVDYSNVDYSKVDWNKVDYSKVDWSKVDYSKIDWTKVNYPKGTGAAAAPACPPVPKSPFEFTSYYAIHAEPGQVVNGTTPTGGLVGTSGTYLIGLNSYSNTICYNITLNNFRGDYMSPARTATHLHEAARGQSGSPRVAFPNPVAINADGSVRRSVGCMTGPFMTGLNVTGTTTDTGAAFNVKQIEANPAGFFVDVHSSLAVPGAVRGQMA